MYVKGRHCLLEDLCCQYKAFGANLFMSGE